MAVDSELRDRLMAMADERAAMGYRKGILRKGAKAFKAAQELEALQYALAMMRDEIRRDGLCNITPVSTPFLEYVARQS